MGLLKLYPRRCKVVYELQEPGKENRLNYIRWFKRFIGNDMSALDIAFFTDKAWFDLNGETIAITAYGLICDNDHNIIG